MPYQKPSVIFDDNKDELYSYLVQEFNLEKEWNNLKLARESGEEKSIAWAAHYAWENLPDSSSIRHGPFFALCNMAEQAFTDPVRE